MDETYRRYLQQLGYDQAFVQYICERIKLRQNDQFLQQWNNEKSSSSRDKIYSIFK